MVLKILVVDNNPVILKLMTNLLAQKEGHQVLTASDGLSALECLNQYNPDIFFIDLIMPNISGDKLCRIIRCMPKHRNSTLVVLSSFAAENKLTPVELGADACIAKGPFEKTTEYIHKVINYHTDGTIKELAHKILGLDDILSRETTSELLYTKNHFEIMLKNISEGILELSHNSDKVIFANTAAQKIIGLPEERILSMELPSIFQGLEGKRIKELLGNRGKLVKGFGEENPFHINNRLLLLDIIPVEDERGAFTIVVLKDITLRKQAEEEKHNLQSRLQQAHKMEAIGTLAGGIAHDFNNLLGTILGYTELAKEDTSSEKNTFKYLSKTLIAGHKAKDLVKQILAFSRQADMERIPIQPASIIKEATKMLRSSIPTTIEIKQDIDPKCSVILADPTQLHQILINLSTNAFHSLEETGGTIEIKLKNTALIKEDFPSETEVKPGAYIKLTVRDNGPGITPEIKNKIFDPYFTTKEQGKGTGLGLSIIHGIVKNYGGKIDVESKLGQGTSFHVYLPVNEGENVQNQEPEKEIPGGNESILFVDDEELLADIGKEMLERLGYCVTLRKNSIEAFEAFRNQPDQFDLVITDQTMPGMTGSDLARRVLQVRPDIPIILCTGYSSIISEDKAKAIGIKEFALKPIVKKDIAKLIRKVLDSH